jgi:hypothetical protein
LIVCFPVTAKTQPQPGEAPKHVTLNKGDKAPFAGKLLTPEALAKIITDYEKKVKLQALEIEKLKRESAVTAKTEDAICKAKLEGEAAKLKACEAASSRNDQIWTKALDKCNKPTPWYKSQFLGFTVGSLFASGICIGVDRASR